MSTPPLGHSMWRVSLLSKALQRVCVTNPIVARGTGRGGEGDGGGKKKLS